MRPQALHRRSDRLRRTLKPLLGLHPILGDQHTESGETGDRVRSRASSSDEAHDLLLELTNKMSAEEDLDALLDATLDEFTDEQPVETLPPSPGACSFPAPPCSQPKKLVRPAISSALAELGCSPDPAACTLLGQPACRNAGSGACCADSELDACGATAKAALAPQASACRGAWIVHDPGYGFVGRSVTRCSCRVP